MNICRNMSSMTAEVLPSSWYYLQHKGARDPLMQAKGWQASLWLLTLICAMSPGHCKPAGI